MIRIEGQMTIRRCINCESRKNMSRFEGGAFIITHAGATTTVTGLSGWRCDSCGEVDFDAESARRYAVTGDELVLQGRVR